jgi:hypothetical protein
MLVEFTRTFYDEYKYLNRKKALAFYKRSFFLINNRFQLGFSLIVCSVIFVSSLIYPVFILDFLTELTLRYPEISSNLQLAQSDLFIFLGILQFFFISMVFIMFIFLTHKIAGPMHKLINHLADIRQGKPISPLTFRNGDHFHEVADEVTLFLDTLVENQESDFQFLDEVSYYIDNLSTVVPEDKKPILEEISRRLNHIKNRYRESH